MAVNVKKQNESDATEPDFVLKHRIVGAAFLLFFGALFLPWLLGAPSEASKAGKVDSVTGLPASSALAQVQAEQLEEELLLAIEGKQSPQVEPQQEQVYVSKITPLDSNQGDLESAATASGAVQESSKTANADSAGSDSSNNSKATADAAGKRQAADATKAANAANAAVRRTDDAAARSGSTEKQDKLKSSAPDQVAQASESVASITVEVGWIVQVGVFTDKNGAAKVVADLKAKGFSPTTTIVDTNRGKLTGTRIWLGPYAQRVDAAKAKTRLTEKTGEAGFIRAFP